MSSVLGVGGWLGDGAGLGGGGVVRVWAFLICEGDAGVVRGNSRAIDVGCICGCHVRWCVPGEMSKCGRNGRVEDRIHTCGWPVFVRRDYTEWSYSNRNLYPIPAVADNEHRPEIFEHLWAGAV